MRSKLVSAKEYVLGCSTDFLLKKKGKKKKKASVKTQICRAL